mgnify:CR=1 FL=1
MRAMPVVRKLRKLLIEEEPVAMRAIRGDGARAPAGDLAKAMIGARAGDTVKWRRPAGEADIEIVEIRYPKKA